MNKNQRIFFSIKNIIRLFIVLSFCLIAEEDFIKKGLNFYYQNKLEMAEVMLNKAINQNPENDKAYSYLGDIALHNKDYIKAIKLYKKASELNLSNGWNYFGLALSYDKMEQYDEAIKYYKLAYQTDKKLTSSLLNLGNLYYRAYKDKENTIKMWEKYLDLEPNAPQKEEIIKAITYLKDPNFKFPDEIKRELEEKSRIEAEKKRNELIESIQNDDIEIKKTAEAEKKKESQREHGIISDDED